MRVKNKMKRKVISKKEKKLLMYSKNKERRIFGATEKNTISPIPLQSISTSGESSNREEEGKMERSRTYFC